MIKNKMQNVNGEKTAVPANRLNKVTKAATMPPSILTPPATQPTGTLFINLNNKTNHTNNSRNGNNYNNSNNNAIGHGLPQRNPVERELIGNFLLQMADAQVVSARIGWLVNKQTLRRRFEQFLLCEPNNADIRLNLSINGTYNIGTLLQRTNFLMNTPRGASYYRIKSVSLMEFRREKNNALDEERQNDFPIVSNVADAAKDGPIVQKFEVDEQAESVPLKYQKTQKQSRDVYFELNSMGCYICQCNFDSIEKYEEHIEYHGDESEFESLKEMTKYLQPMLKLSYQTCVDSHYFGFTLETQLKDIVIDKFIIVQSRQFYYVYNNRLPLEVTESGKLIFFVDSHVFVILREQPIVIGYSQLVDGQRHHYMEQHHFMRTEALPKPSFNVNPYRLSSNKLFRGGRLEPAIPPKQVLAALKYDEHEAEIRLAEFNKEYRSYCELGRELTQQNLYGALCTLLQVEDIERLQCYVALKQSNMELHQFGKELSVRLQPNPRNLSAEDVLSPGDDVLIINERCTFNGQTGTNNNSLRQLLDNNGLILELALKDFDALKRWGQKINELFGMPEKERRNPRVYFARVLGVSSHRVNITCDRHLLDNTTYALVFRPVRAVLRYQYRALRQLKLTNPKHMQRLLFPNAIERERLTFGELNLFNDKISSNLEQLQAVQQIAFSEKLQAPYIIIGPPGTGKTATVCEAIYQLYITRPNTHILVLAGSNTACDEVALRLLRSIPKVVGNARSLTRIFAASCDRRIDNIDDLLLDYSNMYTAHFYPDVQAVHEYRIVVCTLSLAGKLSTGGFGRDGVFSHVFVDEAAASTEAEVLMGITSTIAPSTNLILSGDHKQLGPVLQSHRAGEWGLAVSLFDRLLQRECYRLDENGDYNAAIQTRLRRNYRSHPEIVKLYGDLYYNGLLISQAAPEKVCLAKDWFHTTNEEFPIMFHSVFGTTMNTQSSLSLCNNKEIDAVMYYVKDLMYLGINGQKLAQTDIGIISPYKNQYQRIQEQLNMRNWHQIECGSVELFQGKEKQIIIVSFVRSFTEKLGFLNNSRRLNVLLSRAISLLILIGNPRTLSKNEEFRHIIDMCRDRKTLVGSPYYPDDNKANETNGGGTQTADSKRSGRYYGMNNHQGQQNPYQQQQQQKDETKTENTQTSGQTLKQTTVINNVPLSSPSTIDSTNADLLKMSLVTPQTNLQKTSETSELEQIFDDLPNVPHHAYNYDTEDSIRAAMQNLSINGQSKVLQNSNNTTKTATNGFAQQNVTTTYKVNGALAQKFPDFANNTGEISETSAPHTSSSPIRRISQHNYLPTEYSRFNGTSASHSNSTSQITNSRPWDYGHPAPKPNQKKKCHIII